MIDYLQLMAGSEKSRENRTQEVSEITRNLKMAARELEIPIILLSQLSRQSETRKDHRPMLSDLRESGSIEQDADMVLFIYRSDMYNDIPQNEREQDIAEIIIAKNRSGKCDTIKTKWVGSITSFLNLEKDANAQSLEESMPIPQTTTNPNMDKAVSSEEQRPDDLPLEETPKSTEDSLQADNADNAESSAEMQPLTEEDELLDIFE